LNFEAILREQSVSGRRRRLDWIRDRPGLRDVYGATIERIKKQKGSESRLAMEALMWISHAERPLSANELRNALAIDLGSTDFDADNMPSVAVVVGCCQGLIAVDREASTVRLIHPTLQHYLSAHLDIYRRPHSAMAEICLTYLNSEQVRAISAGSSPNIRDTPFLKYCSAYWGVHAKKELSARAKSLALELLRGYDGHISARLLLEQEDYLDRDDPCPSFQFSGLHCASFFGIVDVVAALTQMECYDINERDFLGYTPLVWAARNGHGEVVSALLGQEAANPEKPDNCGRTPFLHAAQYGHEGVVKILLGRGEIDPDKPDNYAQTPFSYAAWGGHEGVVKTLLDQAGVHPDKPNNYGKTPLSYAAWDGREEVVKILLGRDEVNPDRPDRYSVTPLSYAAWRGHKGVVKMLLGRKEVNPDKPDNRGQTPLSYASQHGHEGVVEILLWREEVNPNKPDNGGRTPLSYAAQYGREGVAGILLNREDVAPDKPDNGGQTPVMFAAKHGHDKVVALLQPYEQ